MNRVILLGNGFDLAHGLKTTYNDFIFANTLKCFEKAEQTRRYSDGFYEIIRNTHVGFAGSHTLTSMANVKEYLEDAQYNILSFPGEDYRSSTHWKAFTWTIKNDFILHLVLRCCDLRWVDIENEYYTELKDILTIEEAEEKKSALDNLNAGMRYLKTSLRDYLDNLPVPDTINEYFGVFSHKISVEEEGEPEYPAETLVLNFNYTKTPDLYIRSDAFVLRGKVRSLQIHGDTRSDRNPMIFGFGDELDEYYKKIESQTLRGFFTNIKSFGYFQTNNYQSLIRFIESAQFQVYILGHACGLSDRTMLNMIFEHKNRVNIKIFYHEFDGGDNYNELIEDISRHFTDKKIMREVISTRLASIAMPQARLLS